jgi:hypothetical protein
VDHIAEARQLFILVTEVELVSGWDAILMLSSKKQISGSCRLESSEVANSEGRDGTVPRQGFPRIVRVYGKERSRDEARWNG